MSRGTHGGQKLLGLEVLRFGAALSILLWHYQHFYFATDEPVGFFSERQPLFELLRPVYLYGHYGVEVFWCISGFIFFWKYRAPIAERAVGPWAFFVLRFSRLYPLHAATLPLVAVLQFAYRAQVGGFFVYQHNDLTHFMLQLLYVHGWNGQQSESFNGPSWSVSIEVLVYLGFFVLLRYVTASAWVNVGVVALWLGFRATGGESLVVDAFGYFYAGGLLALAAGRLPARQPRGGHERVGRFVAALGNLTYSSYLLHFPIQVAIMLGCSMLDLVVPADRLRFLIGYLGVTLALAYVTYRWFERPAQNWIRTHGLVKQRAETTKDARPSRRG